MVQCDQHLPVIIHGLRSLAKLAAGLCRKSDFNCLGVQSYVFRQFHTYVNCSVAVVLLLLKVLYMRDFNPMLRLYKSAPYLLSISGGIHCVV
jgi:hypothetical protein